MQMHIIKPVEYSEWTAPIIVLSNPYGKSRLFVDYSTSLNDALELNKHPLPLQKTSSLPSTDAEYSLSWTCSMLLCKLNWVTNPRRFALSTRIAAYTSISACRLE
ncbi:unnamed protein product [Toxocara canis]|uniref:Reverse transcriptase n=1 Tax=Toxocara canis TaxID=6265 RepID=A0A183UR93_TOXCA|nr:unnamed protein product [Toxocara canis]